ncbi:MAG: hypothetical protein ACK4HV_06975 [Parachlamydiaceae bacterium]
MVVDLTRGRLKVVPQYSAEAILFYNLKLNEDFVLSNHDCDYRICDARKFRLYQDEDQLIAEFSYQDNSVRIVKIDPSTKRIKQVIMEAKGKID